MARIIRQLDDEALEKPFNKAQFLRLLRYMKPYKRQIIGSLVLMVVAMVCSLASPFLMSRAIGELQEQAVQYLPYLLGGMVLVGLIGALCTRQRIRWMDTAGRKALSTLRSDLFRHIQSMSFSFFDTRSAGKLLVRVINDVNSLNDLFTNGIVNVLIECMTMILLLGIMFVVDWRLTLIGMCIIPLLLLILFKLKRVMRLRQKRGTRDDA